jgi:predicted transcriptional regulator
LLAPSAAQDQDISAILHLFSTATEISVATIIKELGFSRATATRKLSALTKQGRIKKLGKGRGVCYVIS